MYSPSLQPPLDYGRPAPCRHHSCSHLCLHSPSQKNIFLGNSNSLPSPGTFSITGQCECPTGTTLLADGKTCSDAPQKFLLFARPDGLFRVSLDTEDYSVLPLEDSLTDSNETRHDATDVDYDHVNHEIYWVDVELNAVRASKEYKGGVIVTRTVMDNLGGNDGFALDIRGRNFYWTDEKRQCIHIAPMDGSTRKIIIWTDLDHPRAITVHSSLNYIFWTDWGDVPKIERAAVDGSARTTIVHSDLGWPNGIVLDEEAGILYWVDGQLHRIESCRFDGSGRQVLLEEHLQHLSGLTLLHSILFWPEHDERKVAALDLSNSKNYTRVDILRNTPNVGNIKAVERLEPLPLLYETVDSFPTIYGNRVPCFFNKSGCSHLCFRRPSVPEGHYYCSCPSHMDLSSDNHTCINSHSFLLYAGGKENVHRMSLSSLHTQALPISPVKSTTSVAFDPVSAMVYRADSVSRAIFRSFLNDSESEAVVRYGLSLPHSIALDYVSRNLYWADMELNRIEVCRLDGSGRRVLVWKDIVKPYTVAVEPHTHHLFWSELRGESGVIKKSWLDGSHPEELVSSELGHQISLAVGVGLNGSPVVFWSDTEKRKISSCSDDGSNIKVLVQKVSVSTGISFFNGKIYWANEDAPRAFSLYSADAETGRNIARVKSFPNFSGLVFTVASLTVASEVTLAANPCIPNNGGCSHLCIPPPASEKGLPHCACPTHFTLAADKKSCLRKYRVSLKVNCKVFKINFS